MSFDYQSITKEEIEKMLFLIQAHAGRIQAKRFNGLLSEQRQKATFVLRNRARRAKNCEQPFDIYIVREVVDDAQKNIFIFQDEIYK